jgi:hypothetical protein
MKANDKAALELAMKVLERHPTWGPAIKERLEGKKYETPHAVNGEWIFAPEPWDEVAKFAASICQSDALNLAPWEHPPCNAHVDTFGNDGSLRLLAKMEAAGISQWHPDPMRALEEAGA